MGSYRPDVPLTKQTKAYLFNSKSFLESIGHGHEDLLVLINYALRLFENYLDLFDGGFLVMGFSQIQKNIFSMEEVSKEMRKRTLGIIPFKEISQDYFDWLETIRVKADLKNNSEVIIYAISYFAFLVEVFENKGDIFIGKVTSRGLVLSFYNIDLFESYRPQWIH